MTAGVVAPLKYGLVLGLLAAGSVGTPTVTARARARRSLERRHDEGSCRRSLRRHLRGFASITYGEGSAWFTNYDLGTLTKVSG